MVYSLSPTTGIDGYIHLSLSAWSAANDSAVSSGFLGNIGFLLALISWRAPRSKLSLACFARTCFNHLSTSELATTLFFTVSELLLDSLKTICAKAGCSLQFMRA